ncbi:uncharacterized protein LOC122368585 [Amphibalanus amphitrite]|uniref:uncharacterized protein LOC122368585 n=1 Tax=Amphibalanus amphitrite TaxID=1232801 RepID=UPI001C9163CD|nr:uncharacterized protein LOC122368585 [Amphibalanus amphitrite]XP_043198608.1 uncharacterized protein LOC122368585 [Amphibalanus amphitrite]
MDLGGSGMDLQETQSVVGLHVDADDLTMDEQQAGVELVAGGQQQDWCHVSQAPVQVVRILGANGEELQMLSTDYHNMDGHPVTIVPDDTGQYGSLDVELQAAPSDEHTDMVEPSLTIQLDIPFVTADNQHDPEVQFFADIYRFLVAGVAVDTSEASMKSLKKRLKEYSVIDGELYYGSRNPRLVVLDKQRQNEIIAATHIDPSTGVHLGVKRMYSAIRHYWRGVYNDLTQYVRKCAACYEGERLSRPPGLDITSLPDQAAAAERLQRTAAAAAAAAPKAEPPTPAAALERTRAEVMADRATRVWKKVEARIYGPYVRSESGCEYLLGLVDPVSRWIEALPVPAADCCARLADFIFRTFCTRGFAQCALVGVTERQFEELHDRYKGRFERMQEIFQKLQQPGTEQNFVFTLQEASAECSWATDMMDKFVDEHGSQWDVELDAFLFGYHATPRADYGFSPFYIMYARHSNGAISEEDKENCTILEEEKALEAPVRVRRRLQSSTLQCRHCSEIFTSKISFRIHQRKHTEEAKKRGVLDGELPLRPVAIERKLLKRAVKRKQRRPMRPGGTKISHRQPRPGWTAEPPPGNEDDQERQQLTSNTVHAVRALIEATREERSRRGKYIKYSEELRDEIAEYALKHGQQEAAHYYSQCLGGQVSISSIRNFIKAYRVFTPEVKDEIGRFAIEYGPEEATAYFSNKLGKDLKVGVVKKYMKASRARLRDGAPSAEEPAESKPKPKHTFTPQLKEEIGRYSLQHGIAQAIQVYTGKLQFAMKESTVRKFRKMVMESDAKHEEALNAADAETAGQQQAGYAAAEPAPLEMQLQQQVNVISQPCSVASGYVYNTYTIPVSQAAAAGQTFAYPPAGGIIVNPYSQPPPNYQTFSCAGPAPAAAPSYISSPMLPVIQQAPPASVQQQALQQQPQQVQATPSPQQQQYLPQMMDHLEMRADGTYTRQDPLEMATSEANIPGAYGVPAAPGQQVQLQQQEQEHHQPQEQHQEQQPPLSRSLPDPELVAPHSALPSLPLVPTKLEMEDELFSEDDQDAEPEPAKSRDPGPDAKSRSPGSTSGDRKRGNYTSYSPEIRAEVGKYAFEHGNHAAMVHFRERLGCDLPESTIRGLKEKYVVKLRRTGDTPERVTALGFAQRGRPIRLGRYDRVVQDCIRELVTQGEKVSSFLCIATAKQVLMQYEPDLLEEHGGPIKLNATWAKSFLKRLGLNQHNS